MQMPECSKGSRSGLRVLAIGDVQWGSSRGVSWTGKQLARGFSPLLTSSISYTGMYCLQKMPSRKLYLALPFPLNPSQTHTFSPPSHTHARPKSFFQIQRQRQCCGPYSPEVPVYFGLAGICLLFKQDRLIWKNDLHLFTFKVLNF